jgi:hypothetical protein
MKVTIIKTFGPDVSYPAHEPIMKMKIEIVDELAADDSLPKEFAEFDFSPDHNARQVNEPVKLTRKSQKIGGIIIADASRVTRGDLWVYRGRLVQVTDAPVRDRDGLVMTEVQHAVLKQQKAFEKRKGEIELFKEFERFKKFEGTSLARREPIPDDVRIFVWRRDDGKCVRCGSQKRIEFDHIIPLEKGGNNTARNLQVLCERCNRQKGTTV